MTKLPRRTMTMAKKITPPSKKKPVAKGKPKQAPEPIKEPVSTIKVLLGAVIAGVIAFVVIGGFRSIFPGGGLNTSMLPDGYRDSVGLFEPTPTVTVVAPTSTPYVPLPTAVTRGDESSDVASQFPAPESVEPIIVEVACPTGSIEIMTGEAPASTVCIVGEIGASPNDEAE